MIKINLLPPELQRAARTPKVLFFSLVGGVCATMLIGFAVLWLWFSVNSLRDVRDQRQADVNILKEQALEVDRINEDIAFYKEREKAIIEIKARRITWAPKLDQLVDRTPTGVWITRMAMKTLGREDYKWQAGKDQTGGQFSLTCFAQGTEITALTNYRKALSGERAIYKGLVDVSALPDNFFGDFVAFSEPSWSRVELEQFVEKDNLRFVLDMHLKPRFEKPAAAAGKKGR